MIGNVLNVSVAINAVAATIADVSKFILVWFWLLPGLTNDPDNQIFRKFFLDNYKEYQSVYTFYFVEEEIIDKKYKYFLREKQEALDMITKYIKELDGAPKVKYFHIMPSVSREEINKLIQFNREFKNFLEERKIFYYDTTGLIQIIKENEYCYQVYDTIRDVKCEYYHVQVRRLAIKKLIELIGEQNYFYGNLPPHVPFNRFQYIP